MTFYRTNLLIALNMVLKKCRAEEKAAGYTGDSGFTGGIQELVTELENGLDVIRVKDSD